MGVSGLTDLSLLGITSAIVHDIPRRRINELHWLGKCPVFLLGRPF